jgi:hypothetical protein
MAIKRFVHALLLIVTTENFAHDMQRLHLLDRQQ